MVTLDSKLSYDNTEVSAWNVIQGLDADSTYLNIDVLGWDATGNVPRFTIKTSEMFASSVQLSAGEYFSIHTISLASRYNNGQGDQTDYSNPVTLTFSYGGVSYTGTASYNYLESGTAGAGKVTSIDFTLGEALEVSSLNFGDISVSISFTDSNAGKFGLAVAQGQGGSTLSGTTPIYDVWSPVVHISGTVIPEPSTFGLLAGLGALALVGTRRRRK